MSYLVGDAEYDYAPKIARPLSKTPQHLLYASSAAAIVVAVFRNPAWSAIAYAVLLVVGSGLLFFDRVRVVIASRKGNASGGGATLYSKGAFLALLLGCLGNGLVVAVELARG